MAHQNRLANTHVLVFGGTSGIGFAVASMSLSYGARVTISGSSQPKVDSKVEYLRSLYPNTPSADIAGVAADLLDKENIEENLKAMLDKVTENGKKRIDHIAFTAGDGLSLPKLGELDLSTTFDMFTVRFLAACALAKVIHNNDYMPKSSSSSITMTGGTNTHRPTPNFFLGASVGGALEGLTRGLAIEMAPIRVNLVHPGAIYTELFQKYIQNSSPEAVEKLKKTYSLTGEFGQPEDIAEAYGWIMKDRFANGTQVSSDGGRLLVGS